MKRKTKIATVLTAVMLLAMGTAFTSQAAWEQQGGNWIFTDTSGNRVRDSWRQTGNYYYYLDHNGIMATNRWIDDTYYVDVNGVRVTDRWIYTESQPYQHQTPHGSWYYLDTNGRAVRDGWRTIHNQHYHFDYDGTMQYGWFREGNNLYYLGDWNDGAVKTGWMRLDIDEYNGQENGMVSAVSSDGSWFYFQENGKAVKADGGPGYANRTINGFRYYFDERGVMATGWTAVGARESGDATGISTFRYFGNSGEGQMARGWRYLTEYPDHYENGYYERTGRYDGDGAWYYFDNNGVPAYLKSNAASLSDATARIGSNRYFFDAYGRMGSGLIGFSGQSDIVISAYFGANDSDGRMKTDRQTNVIEENGERSTFYFGTSGNRGAGFTGEYGGYLYHAGKLVRSERGEDMQVFEVGGRRYLVNESGRVQDSNQFYRVNGEYRYEFYNGTIYYVNNQRERLGEVTQGAELPDITYMAVYPLYNAAQ